jgi:hypothetical protein
VRIRLNLVYKKYLSGVDVRFRINLQLKSSIVGLCRVPNGITIPYPVPWDSFLFLWVRDICESHVVEVIVIKSILALWKSGYSSRQYVKRRVLNMHIFLAKFICFSCLHHYMLTFIFH